MPAGASSPPILLGTSNIRRAHAYRRHAASLRPCDAHQLEHLVAAGDVALADDADTARVELHREHRLLEPAPLVAAHHAREGAGRHTERRAVLHDPGLVL